MTPTPPPKAEIEEKILGLLANRQEGATICPSEVARALVSDDGPWRDLMPLVRQVAEGMVREHRLRVTRGGVQVSATGRGGPVRLGRPVERDGT